MESTSVNPRDATAVAAVVADWTAARFGGPVTVAGTPTTVTGGLDSYVHFVDLAGVTLPTDWQTPLVVRVLPAADRLAQARREAAVQTWCADSGYDAPRVLTVLEASDGLGLPAQIMQRAPGKAMIAAITSKPWQARSRIQQLAALAGRLHALPTDGWPGPSEPLSVVDSRLALPRRVVATSDRPELAAALAAAEDLAPRSINDERVVCHGDFHPLNVVVGSNNASVIDWTDAALGPREADVSRTALLFNVAVIAGKTPLERAVLKSVGPRMGRRYLSVYEQHAPLDHHLLKVWEVFHSLHGWAQLEVLDEGGFDGESSSTPDSVDPSVKAIVRQHFEAALAAVR